MHGMAEEAVHAIPSLPQSWGLARAPDGRYDLTCHGGWEAEASEEEDEASEDDGWLMTKRECLASSSATASRQRRLRTILRSRQVQRRLLLRGGGDGSGLGFVNGVDAKSTSIHICVSANAARHVFRHAVQLVMKHDTFRIACGLFDTLHFERTDLRQTYFRVARVANADCQYLVVYDSLGVPIYHVRDFDAADDSAVVVDSATRARASQMDAPYRVHASYTLIWAFPSSSSSSSSSSGPTQHPPQPSVVVTRNAAATHFEMLDVTTARLLATVSRKTKPFSKVTGQPDTFTTRVAPCADSALVCLWSVLMIRSFCL